MDELVLRGMAKWPNVPAVFGWLRLDRRGNWLLKGDRISHPAITSFIGRNYAHDERGRWFFQNGPQRVYVALDYTPFVYRITGPEGGPLEIETHTGRAISVVDSAWIDEAGALLLATEADVGVVHDGDLERLLPQFVDAAGEPLPEDVLDARMELIERGQPALLWIKLRAAVLKVGPLRASAVAAHFGFVATPVPFAGEAACA